MDIDVGGVLDALPGLVWTTQADGMCGYVNRRFREFTGLGFDAALGLHWQTAIHPDDLASFVSNWHAIVQSGVVSEIEGRLRRADGQYRWFAFRLSRVSEDAGGTQRWCWLGLDADEAVTGPDSPRPDGRLRRFLDMMPTQVVFMTPSLDLEFVNREVLDYYGKSLEELRQWASAGKVSHPDDLPGIFERLTRLRTLGEPWDNTSRMLRADGAFRWMRSRMVPSRDAEGNIARYVSCQTEVHDLKQAEDLLAGEVRVLEMAARGKPLRKVLDALCALAEELCSGCTCSILLVPRARTQSQVGSDGSWSMPILSGSGQASGVFAVHRGGPGAPSAFERQLIERLCSIAGIAVDRARTDVELQRSQAYLAEAQRVSLTGSFGWRVSSDEHFWSEETFRIFGLDPSTELSMPKILEFVHPEDLPLAEEVIANATAGRDFDVELRTVLTDGLLKHLHVVGHALQDRDGIWEHVGAVQDVTERRRAEAELRQANAQLTDAHRLSRTGSFTWDVLLDRHIWTEEIFRLFEFDSAIPVNMAMMLEVIHPEDMPAVQALLDGAVIGVQFDLVFRVIPRSGAVKHARVVGRRIGKPDQPVFMGALQDVTASKLAEEALNSARSQLAHVARVAALNTLTASIAHEVSQPILGILTNANTCLRMLADEPPNVEGAIRTARRTIRDADRASEVIKRLRAMFGKEAPSVEDVDLNEAAQEVIALSATELRSSRAVVKTHFSEDLPLICGDRIQLQQVILNLLLNAADAMAQVEDRPRSLLIQTELRGDDQVQLFIRDAGIGVHPEAFARLFDPFYTTKARGMGIGLSISRSIVESHEGQLWAAANDGPGATFGFYIPRLGVTATLAS
jgi:PAS domain S-box-containing protein